ncbi:DinB family protein [Dictyobacter arantiisoli]|uniref:DinB-like domain-containing protein n=1 Tax=Dictyobacter arantiisoli TaxID=2014874 RepID=A0A5A5TGS4_9CHLR|nr:DinB family protein [Dictyobacter arantiisoli]GCF10435.1 hypothetical protein KDI_39990 [Dictyobacter arantiisoli]
MAALEIPFVRVRRKMVAARIDFMSQLAVFHHEDLLRPFTDDGITPLMVVQHLIDADRKILQQLRRVQEDDNPLFDTFAHLLPVLVDSAQPAPSLDEALRDMVQCRDELFAYLSQLPASAWERPFHSNSWGVRKFSQLVNTLPLHDRQHSRQLSTFHAHSATS